MFESKLSAVRSGGDDLEGAVVLFLHQVELCKTRSPWWSSTP